MDPSGAPSSNGLLAFVPGVWLSSDPVRIVGMRLEATMAVVQLPNDALLLFSPVSMTEVRRRAVEALGTVTHLYAPNTFHHMSLGAWADAFPQARVHAPAALQDKRPSLRIDRAHDREPLGALGDVFDEVHIEGFALEETVLVHRRSRTLLVADLVHNIGRPQDPWTAFYSRSMGFYDRVAISRMIRWTAFFDRASARRSIDRLAESSFEHLVVGHGAPLVKDAHRSLLEAYAWLQPRRSRLPAIRKASVPQRGCCG